MQKMKVLKKVLESRKYLPGQSPEEFYGILKIDVGEIANLVEAILIDIRHLIGEVAIKNSRYKQKIECLRNERKRYKDKLEEANTELGIFFNNSKLCFFCIINKLFTVDTKRTMKRLKDQIHDLNNTISEQEDKISRKRHTGPHYDILYELFSNLQRDNKP